MKTRLKIVLASILVLVLVGFAGAVGLVLYVASNVFDTDVADLKDVDRREVARFSTFGFLPLSASRIHYSQTSFQDTMEVFYFQAPRQDVDAFSIRLLGFVPETRESREDSWLTREGWPQPPASGGRYGHRNETEVGGREVLIVDHATYSEVWFLVSNWCETCKSADLTGKPPEENPSTITYGSEMPPPLPPPPPRQ